MSPFRGKLRNIGDWQSERTLCQSFFAEKWRGRENFFLSVLSCGNFQYIPRKKVKKSSKNAFGGNDRCPSKIGWIYNAYPGKSEEREAGKEKIEQIVNKKIIKIHPLKIAVGSVGAGRR